VLPGWELGHILHEWRLGGDVTAAFSCLKDSYEDDGIKFFLVVCNDI